MTSIKDEVPYHGTAVAAMAIETIFRVAKSATFIGVKFRSDVEAISANLVDYWN